MVAMRTYSGFGKSIVSAAILCLLGLSPAPVRGEAAPETPAAQAADPFAEGDAAFKLRGDSAQAWRALKIYRQLHERNPDDPQAGWRRAMACYFVGLRLEKDKNARKALFEEGKNAGLAAAEKDPNCAPCHFWGAITLALYGDAVGVFKMLFAVKQIEKHLEASIRLDEKYAYGGAHRLLGLISQKLPGVLGGSDDEAKKHFKRAIEVAPDEPLNYLFLAKLLKEEFNDRKGALKYIDLAMALPEPAEDRLESRESLKEIRGLKEKWDSGGNRKKKDSVASAKD